MRSRRFFRPVTGQTRGRGAVGGKDIRHRLRRFARIVGKAGGIVAGSAQAAVFRVNLVPRGGQMAIGAQGTRGLLGKIRCLDSQGVRVIMPTEIGAVAGNALPPRSLADGATKQGAIVRAVTGSTA